MGALSASRDPDEVERLEARLRRLTRQLVHRHVGKVEALARALWTAGTIADDAAIRIAAGLPPAPVEGGLWRAAIKAEVVPGKLAAARSCGASWSGCCW